MLAAGVAGGVGALVAGGCGDAKAGVEAGSRPLTVTASFGEVGLSPGQFTYPRCIDGDGKNLYVIDKAAHVQRLDPATGRATAMWTMPEMAMGKPCGVTVGPDGLIYVADTHYFRVMVYRPPAELGQGAELVSQWGGYGKGPGQFIYVTDVGLLTDAKGEVERIYVSEYGENDRVSVFDRDHTFLFSFGAFGDGSDPTKIEFNRPQSIGIDKERGEVVVTDACNHRVGVFTLDGKLVRWIGKGAGDGTEQFGYPYGLVLRPDHTALVTEFGNHRIHHVDLETGATVGIYGRPGRGEGELTNPWAITVMGDTAYVLDSGNARVQAFRTPALIRKSGGKG